MNELFRKFLIRVSVLSFLVAGAGFLVFLRIWPEYYFHAFPLLLVFFLIVSAVVYYFLLKAKEDRPEKFPRFMMAVNGIKIFIYLIFLAVYLLLNKENVLPFLVSFLALYFIFTFFQTIELQRIMRKSSSDRENTGGQSNSVKPL